jgi:hypothetical protein
MRHIEKREDFIKINEAKSYPVGTIIKVSNKNQLGKNQGGRWQTFYPEQVSGVEGGLFYMEVKNSGRIWLEGPIVYNNCLTNDNISTYTARVSSDNAEPAGDEFRIFKKNDAEIKKIMNTSFFLDGSEPGIMSNDGKAITTVPEAEYTVSGINFKLSDLYDEPVMWLKKKSGGRSSTTATAGFSIKISDLTVATKELNNDQKEIIAEWFAKQLDADIVSTGDKFQISTFKIYTSDNGVYPAAFSAGPFINEKQAKIYLDLLKKEPMTLFNVTNLKIDSDRYSKSNLNIEEMIAFSKTLGITTTMKQLLALKKGAVTAKKFGL